MRRADVVDLLSDMGFTLQDAGVYVLRAKFGERSWLLRFTDDDTESRNNSTLMSVREEAQPPF